MTPEEFAAAVRALSPDVDDPARARFVDNEAQHEATDALMERVLTDLGYGAGVEMIRKTGRWYA